MKTMRIPICILLILNAAVAFAQYGYDPVSDYGETSLRELNQEMNDLMKVHDEYTDSMERIRWSVTPSHVYRANEAPLRETLTIYMFRTAAWYEVEGTITNDTSSASMKWDHNGVLETPATWSLHYGDLVTVRYSGGNAKYGDGSFQLRVGVDDSLTREQWDTRYSHSGILAQLKAQHAEYSATPTYSSSPAGMGTMPYTPSYQRSSRSRAEIMYDIEKAESAIRECRHNMQTANGVAVPTGYAGIISDYERMLVRYRAELANADH